MQDITLEEMDAISLKKDWFQVIHPLDDVAEEKVDLSSLGAMPMTRSARGSLIVLRGYLVLMTALVLVKVILLAKG